MICIECRVQVDDDSLHCHRCGNKLRDNCPICGKLHRTPIEFCTKTGEEIAPRVNEVQHNHLAKNREEQLRPLFETRFHIDEFNNSNLDKFLVLFLMWFLLLVVSLPITIPLNLAWPEFKNYHLPAVVALIISAILTTIVYFTYKSVRWHKFKRESEDEG